MKSALLIRLGGLGDILILGSVAEELKRRGYEVDLCAGSPTCNVEKLFENTNIFRKIYQQTRHFTGLDIYNVEEGDWASVELLKTRPYDLIVDYKYSIELNSHYRHLANSPGKEWLMSQNSNYVNWMDMMLGWAGIDPALVPRENKIPRYVVSDVEKAWAKKLLRTTKPDRLIAIQLNASSLVRTIYQGDQLPKLLADALPGKKVEFVFYDGQRWITMRSGRAIPIEFPTDMDPIRASAALVSQCDLFIGADSGFSHLAEAMKVKSVVTYTTVPAWTRMKYYYYVKALEPVGDTFDGVQCRPCFVLDRYCPRVREKALLELTEREQKIKAFAEKGVHPQEAANLLSTTPQGVMMEFEMTKKRYEALLEMQSPCGVSISPERIVETAKELL